MTFYGEPVISSDISQRAFDTTQQLSLLESAYVHAVLKASLEKLALVGTIIVDPKLQAQELTQSVGEEITRMIKEQKDLEAKFGELLSGQQVLRTLPNKSKLRENQAAIRQVTDTLRQSTKQLSRSLKDNPNVADNMAKVSQERQSLQMLLNHCLAELETRQRLQPILEVVLAHEDSEARMKDTMELERSTTAAVKQLRTDLKEEKKEHEDKMRDKRKTLEALKKELKEMKMATAVDARHQAKGMKAGNECLRRLEDAELADREKELRILLLQVDIETSVHSDSAAYLKRETSKLQESAIHWSQKHEEDMQHKDRQLELLKLDHQKALVQLRDLEEKYKVETEFQHQLEAQEKEVRKTTKEHALLQERRISAVMKIQACFRGWKVRKDVSGSKGKKGSKGRGGKKKKK